MTGPRGRRQQPEDFRQDCIREYDLPAGTSYEKVREILDEANRTAASHPGIPLVDWVKQVAQKILQAQP